MYDPSGAKGLKLHKLYFTKKNLKQFYKDIF